MTTTPLTRALADLVERSPRQRVEVEDLYAGAVAFDRSLATSPTARAEIRAALDELVAAGLVLIPRGPRHFDTRDIPPMPLWVRRPPREKVMQVSEAPRVWPPVLESAGRIASRSDETRLLDVVAAFLREGGSKRASVPLRERSLELFGDEKRIDGLLSTRLFTSGALTPDLLRCHTVPIPFVSQWVPGSPDPRGIALLIAENHHTYASLLEVTREHAATGGPARHIGYGTGAQFPSAVLSVPQLSPRPDRIVYFGDVDLRGLQIPAAASATATRAGLPSVVPALPLYELLFEARRVRPATPVLPDAAAVAAAWSGPFRDRTLALLVDGLRLPQEAVGYELLTAYRAVLAQI